MKKRLLILLSVCFICVSIFPSSPKYEMRAVWITTNWGLDWPSRPVKVLSDRYIQQKELCCILDELQSVGINTVFFQARIRGEVFYSSRYEPWAAVLSHGREPGYDPLAFVIEECHKRAIECHAWLVTFPVGSNRQVKKQGSSSVVARHRSWCKQLSGEWFLDPGNPSVKDYLRALVGEVVSKYDVDGIHLDYVRYPDNAMRFPDTDSFRKWGSRSKSLLRWREDNITGIVTAIYEEVKRLKLWVKVSSSPLGRYASLEGFPAEWSCMEAVSQNPKDWLQSGRHDFIVPMMYFREENYYPFLYDWVNSCPPEKVISGLGVYRLDKSEGNWPFIEIKRQIETTRKMGVGQAYFRYENLHTHTILRQWLVSCFYRYPALTPGLKNPISQIPDTPNNLRVEAQGGVSNISWSPADGAFTYVLYATNDSLDMNTGDQIVAVLPKNIHSCSLSIPYRNYAIVARDRYGTESEPAFWTGKNIEPDKYRITL